jgi:biopolymer transport protein ExbD/biopolymer transport protein TolR
MPRLEPSASSGGVRSRHRARGARVSTALAEINVVPLVDVMLVLLVIFMVAAPMMQQGFEVKLPQARNSRPTTSEPVYITVPESYRSTRRLQIGDDTIPITALAERVRQRLETTETKSVILRGDGAVQLRDLVDVWDALAQAGVSQVSLATQPRTADR